MALHTRIQGLTPRLALACLLGFLLGPLCAPAAAGPAGGTERHLELGIVLSVPRRYEAVPVEPGEELVALRYLEAAREGGARRVRPGFDLFVLEAGRADAQVELLARNREREAVRMRPDRWGYRQKGWELAGGAGGRVEYVHVWQNDERDVLFRGVCGAEDRSELFEELRRTAELLKLQEPQLDGRSRAVVERLYAGSRWSGVEHRVQVRLELVDGWTAHDSEHYIVVHPTLSTHMVERVMARIEELREALGRRFAAQLPSEVVSTVRLCRDREQYLAYGGPPQYVGYWSATAGELVLFDPGSGMTDELRRTLDHELFHQYVHHATGGIAPHPFFNEGWADHIAASVLAGGRIVRSEPNPWRVQRIRELVQAGQHVPLEAFLGWDQSSFQALLGPAYAQAWSLVAFLESPGARHDRRFRGRLDDYFGALRMAWSEECSMAGGPTPGAHERARERALAAFLDGLEPGELEAAWRDFVLELPGG